MQAPVLVVLRTKSTCTVEKVPELPVKYVCKVQILQRHKRNEVFRDDSSGSKNLQAL